MDRPGIASAMTGAVFFSELLSLRVTEWLPHMDARYRSLRLGLPEETLSESELSRQAPRVRFVLNLPLHLWPLP